MTSQITGVSIYPKVNSGADQGKKQSPASLAFVTGEFRAHIGPVTRKMFLFDDVIMNCNVVLNFDDCLLGKLT